MNTEIKKMLMSGESEFLTGAIEKWGSGTTRIADELRVAGLPAPEFVSDQWKFRVVFNKKIFSERKTIQKLDLSERQTKAVEFVLLRHEISNSEFQKLANVSRQTASRELQNLTSMGVLELVGLKCSGAKYRLTKIAIGKIDS